MTFDATDRDRGPRLAERLEQGELVTLPTCPFALPGKNDLDFIRLRKPKSATSAIRYLCAAGRASGFARTTADDAERFASLLRNISDAAAGWLANQLPEYAGQWIRHGIEVRNEEEAIRSHRDGERNDLLHIDASPDHPTHGMRILKLYLNLNVEEPRVWQTSDRFDALLDSYLRQHRLPARTEAEWTRPLSGIQRLLHRDWSGRTAYDSFMLELKRHLIANEEFQEKAPRRLWHFPPGSIWVVFADGLSHAVLRGQYALQHTWLVPLQALARADLSPLRPTDRLGRNESPSPRELGGITLLPRRHTCPARQTAFAA